MHACMHACIHVSCTHARTHACIHACILIYSLTYTHKYVCVYTHAGTPVRMEVRTHGRPYVMDVRMWGPPPYVYRLPHVRTTVYIQTYVYTVICIQGQPHGRILHPCGVSLTRAPAQVLVASSSFGLGAVARRTSPRPLRSSRASAPRRGPTSCGRRRAARVPVRSSH